MENNVLLILSNGQLRWIDYSFDMDLWQVNCTKLDSKFKCSSITRRCYSQISFSEISGTLESKTWEFDNFISRIDQMFKYLKIIYIIYIMYDIMLRIDM